MPSGLRGEMIDVGGSMMASAGLGADSASSASRRRFCPEFGMVGGEKMLGGVIWAVRVALVDSAGV